MVLLYEMETLALKIATMRRLDSKVSRWPGKNDQDLSGR